MLVTMKNALLKSLIIPSLLFAINADAGLYKGMDAEGNVVYSDKPFSNAKEITPPALTVMDAPKIEPKAVAEEVEEESADTVYTKFSMLSPTNNQSIWNDDPGLVVQLQTTPALNTSIGHTIWLLLDGKPLIKNSESLSLSVNRIDRGTHSVQAQIRDKEDKVITLSNAVIIHVKR